MKKVQELREPKDVGHFLLQKLSKSRVYFLPKVATSVNWFSKTVLEKRLFSSFSTN